MPPKNRIRTGTFKYVCDECGKATFLSPNERTSHFRPRCTSCGSTWLTPSHASVARDRLLDAETERHEQNALRDRKMGIKD